MRLFVAIEISNELRQAIAARAGEVRERTSSASWLKPESLHLTLAFLGEQAADDLGKIGAEIATATVAQRRFAVRAGPAGFFPAARAPRVAWIALEPAEQLTALARAVRAALQQQSVAFDEKRFVPHLTICRIRGRWNPADVELFTETFGAIDVEPFIVPEVVLFRSELTPGGAVHTVVQRAPLASEE